jgi:hypothetical protein
MNIFQELEFSQEWIDLGIITPAKLNQLVGEWTSSDDRNTEHYRWRAFLDFVQSQDSLDEITARRLYNLGATDPDLSMGGSIMAHILRRKDCPEDLLRVAAGSDEKFLQRIANEKLERVER